MISVSWNFYLVFLFEIFDAYHQFFGKIVMDPQQKIHAHVYVYKHVLVNV